MRILLLWDYYDRYLYDFYMRHPEASGMPYVPQRQELLDDFFGWPSYLVPQFRELGHESEILVCNARPLQRAWARENDVAWDEQRWQFAVAAEQVRRFRPDVLWMIGAPHYYGAFLAEVRSACRYVVAWRAGDWPARMDWAHVQAALSSNLDFVERFRQLGLRSELVLPCFDDRILACSPAPRRDIVLSFAGTLSPVDFSRRMQLLDFVQARLPLQVYAEKIVWRRRPLPLALFLGQLRCLPFLLRARRHPAVYGRPMFEMLRRSAMTLNVHRNETLGLDFSIRLFEATGSGALLVTEAAPNLASAFEPGRDVVTFSSREELLEKLVYYREHSQERQAIAQAGQRRTLGDHNSRVRAAEVAAFFEKGLPAA